MTTTPEKTERVMMGIRMSPEVHRAVSVAAARSGKSTNAWVTDVLGAASTASNLYALTDELRERQIADLSTLHEFAQRAVELIGHLGIHMRQQAGDATEAVLKLINEIESGVHAHEIRSKNLTD